MDRQSIREVEAMRRRTISVMNAGEHGLKPTIRRSLMKSRAVPKDSAMNELQLKSWLEQISLQLTMIQNNQTLMAKALNINLAQLYTEAEAKTEDDPEYREIMARTCP